MRTRVAPVVCPCSIPDRTGALATEGQAWERRLNEQSLFVMKALTTTGRLGDTTRDFTVFVLCRGACYTARRGTGNSQVGRCKPGEEQSVPLEPRTKEDAMIHSKGVFHT